MAASLTAQPNTCSEAIQLCFYNADANYMYLNLNPSD